MRDSGKDEENQQHLLVWEGGRSPTGQQPSHGTAVFIVDNSVAGAWLRGGDSSMVGQKRGPGSLSPMREQSGGSVVAITCMGND